MYARNYFCCDKSEGGSEEKVPIRWMAPESIESDIYTEKTDVVSNKDIRHPYHLSCGLLGYSLSIFLAVINHGAFMKSKTEHFVCFSIMNMITVGIWCDVLGGILMWRSPLCWCSCHVSTESTPQWPQAGQTQQCHLLRRNVGRYYFRTLCMCVENLVMVFHYKNICMAHVIDNFPHTAGIWWCHVGLYMLNSVQSSPDLWRSSLSCWIVTQIIWNSTSHNHCLCMDCQVTYYSVLYIQNSTIMSLYTIYNYVSSTTSYNFVSRIFHWNWVFFVVRGN